MKREHQRDDDQNRERLEPEPTCWGYGPVPEDDEEDGDK